MMSVFTVELNKNWNRPFTPKGAARREGVVRSNAALKDEGDAKDVRRKKKKKNVGKGKGKKKGRRISEAIWEMHPDPWGLGSRQTQLGNLE